MRVLLRGDEMGLFYVHNYFYPYILICLSIPQHRADYVRLCLFCAQFFFWKIFFNIVPSHIFILKQQSWVPTRQVTL